MKVLFTLLSPERIPKVTDLPEEITPTFINDPQEALQAIVEAKQAEAFFAVYIEHTAENHEVINVFLRQCIGLEIPFFGMLRYDNGSDKGGGWHNNTLVMIFLKEKWSKFDGDKGWEWKHIIPDKNILDHRP